MRHRAFPRGAGGAAGVRLTGIDVSGDSLALAARRGVYEETVRHDLQILPLPVGADAVSATGCAGVLTYIAEAEALLRDVCRCVRPGGGIVFTRREELRAERGFAEMVERIAGDGLWSVAETSEPLTCLPGHADFGDEVKVIHTLCRAG